MGTIPPSRSRQHEACGRIRLCIAAAFNLILPIPAPSFQKPSTSKTTLVTDITQITKQGSSAKIDWRMQFFTLASIAVLAARNVFAWNTTSATNTCYTITEYNKPPCPTPSPCIVADCIILSTITQSCGCSTIPTTNICLTTCPVGCSTQYTKMYLPCPTSPPSRPRPRHIPQQLHRPRALHQP